MPSSCASSSIADSRAKLPLDSPGARMNVGVPMSRRTRRCLVSTFSHWYWCRETSAVGSMKSSSWRRGALRQNASRQGLFGRSIRRRQHVRAAPASVPGRERSGPFYPAVRRDTEPVAAPFSPLHAHTIAAAEPIEGRIVRPAITIEPNEREPSLRTADPHPLLPFLGRGHPDHPPQIALERRSGASQDERREREHLVGAQPCRLGELAEESRRIPAHLGGGPG